MKDSFSGKCTRTALLLIGTVYLSCAPDPDEPKLNNIFDPSAAFDNNPPVARLSVSPDSGITRETEFIFDASRSLEPEMPDAKLYYRWDLNNDGIWDTGEVDNPKFSFLFPKGGGNKTVVVSVRGGRNQYADTCATIFVNSRPTLVVNTQADSEYENLIHFDASYSWDYEDGQNLNYRWDFNNDGSWDIPWNVNPQANYEFSGTDWSLKVQVRDRSNLISEMILPTKPPDDLIAYYPFNGNADDESKNNNPGIVHGATLTKDRFGRSDAAYHFDGIDDFIDLTNSSTLKPDLPVTIVAWIYIEKDGGIFHNNPAFNRYYGFWLNSQANGRISAGFGDGGAIGPYSRRSYIIADTLTKYTWHHVAGIIKGPTDMELIVDGVPMQGSYTGTGGPLAYYLGPAAIGRMYISDPFYYGGDIDDLRIYDRALTYPEILELYAQ